MIPREKLDEWRRLSVASRDSKGAPTTDGLGTNADWAFWLAADEAIPALLDEVDRLRRIEELARGALELIGDRHTYGPQNECPGCELQRILGADDGS